MNVNDQTILIIGTSNVTNKTCKIEKYTTLYDVEIDYGIDSNLYEAYQLAMNYGAENIYLVNMKSASDFIYICDQLRNLDFAYVCPISILFSDTYTDRYNQEEKEFYINLLSRSCYQQDTMIITQDNHAELYQDLDAFNEDYHKKIAQFCSVNNKNKQIDNVIVVANMLRDIKYSNILIAARLAGTPLNEYPTLTDEEPVFLMDYKDMDPNVVYFKSNHRTGTTIENLVNLSDQNPQKSVLVMRIIYYLAQEIHFSKYIGKHARPVYLTRMQADLDDWLRYNVGYVLYDYKVLGIDQEVLDNGVTNITIKYEAYPLFTNESYTAKVRA